MTESKSGGLRWRAMNASASSDCSNGGSTATMSSTTASLMLAALPVSKVNLQFGGSILRDASLRDAPQDEVLQTLMVRSAAMPRVSNHQAGLMHENALSNAAAGPSAPWHGRLRPAPRR